MPTSLPSRIKEMNEVKIIKVESNNDSITFMDGLALLFIGLKLTDHLQDWTWIEVLSPLWGPFMVSWFFRLINNTFFNGEEEGEE